MQPVLNVSAYRFVELHDLSDLRLRIERAAAEAQLKGSVLLAAEGINLFLAGPAAPLRRWLDWLRADRRFAGLQAKESWSHEAPFRRLLVKCKREIIRMDQAGVRPCAARAPAVDPHTLARWLDNGRDDHGRELLLLDARNRFEIEFGRFRHALDLGVDRFTDFARAAVARRSDFDGKTVVSYCTGGIRCEKAAIFLADAGFANVLQLDGGILRYFEEIGARHFDGECFVFDERITLDAQLRPGSAARAATAAA